ncbi:MAG: AMP-binding protein [Myxococcota bacterium]
MLYGILKCGAAYVPTDATAPMARAGLILADCGVRAAFVETSSTTSSPATCTSRAATPASSGSTRRGGGLGLERTLRELDGASPAPVVPTHRAAPDDLAYILYTSGSTGRPKGVMLNHANATHFVEWCSDLLEPTPADRFSSHAPFHFDLSILDLYTPARHGACVVIVPEDVGKEPGPLAELIARKAHDLVLRPLDPRPARSRQGELDRRDYASLRFVLFAGEVFPVVQLRSLKALWRGPRYVNTARPRRTCAPPTRSRRPCPRIGRPYRSGRVCHHLEGRIVDPAGTPVARGEEGELCIAGPNVMQGYWNLPERTAAGFLVTEDGRRWYRTGDIVTEDDDGVLTYVGRRDRMIKKRGYRIELGEIESCLYTHPEVVEAATVAIEDDEGNLRVRAHLATKDGGRLSLIALKRFCAERLPLYMVPDLFRFHASLPKTSTDKVDYQALLREPD